MSYYITVVDYDVRFRPTNKKEALTALKKAAENGCSWSYVDMDRVLCARTLEEGLRACRWSYGEGSGPFEFLGQSLGDDETIFRVLAPFIEPGSYIQIAGEGSDVWRWTFDGEGMADESMTFPSLLYAAIATMLQALPKGARLSCQAPTKEGGKLTWQATAPGYAVSDPDPVQALRNLQEIL